MRGGDTEEVGAGREVGEVEATGGIGLAYQSACIVVDFNTVDIIGLNGDGAGSGVRIDDNCRERFGRRDADLVDGEEEQH